jgi:hypothetical protein
MKWKQAPVPLQITATASELLTQEEQRAIVLDVSKGNTLKPGQTIEKKYEKYGRTIIGALDRIKDGSYVAFIALEHEIIQEGNDTNTAPDGMNRLKP